MGSHDSEEVLASRDIVFLELTNRCNMNCTFCPNHKMTRPRGDMPFLLARSVLDQLKKGGFRGSVITSLMGEPLLHPEFLSIVNYAVSIGLRTNVITNFLSVPEKVRIPALLNAGIDTLCLSYQTPSPESFALRKAPVTFEQYRKKLKDIIIHARDNKIKTRRIEVHILHSFHSHLNCSVVENYSLIEKTLNEFANWLGFDQKGNTDQLPDHIARMVKKFRRGRQHIDAVDIPFGHGIFAVLKRANTWANSLLPAECTVTSRSAAHCDAIRNSLGVFWDGRCTVCCQDFDAAIHIGNVHRQSLAEILGAAPLVRLMQMEHHKNLIHPFCQNCRGRVFRNQKAFRLEKPIGATNRLFQYVNRTGKRLSALGSKFLRN